jgi:hypothetical protein
MKKLFLFILISFFIIGCKKNDDYEVKTFIVAPQKGTYNSWTGLPASSVMVKENVNESYRILGQEIEGFDYVAGFEYTIQVKKYTIANPPADGSNLRYVLIRIISKK